MDEREIRLKLIEKIHNTLANPNDHVSTAKIYEDYILGKASTPSATSKEVKKVVTSPKQTGST